AIDKSAQARTRSYQQILIEKEKGLHGANSTTRILDDEIAIFELRVQCIFDQLIIAMILAFICEGGSPARKSRQIITPDDFEPKGRWGWLRFHRANHLPHREHPLCQSIPVKLPSAVLILNQNRGEHSLEGR